MIWVNILKGLLTLGAFFAKQVERRQLMDAGANEVIKNNAYDSLQKIKTSQEALRRARADKSIVKRLLARYKRDK